MKTSFNNSRLRFSSNLSTVPFAISQRRTMSKCMRKKISILSLHVVSLPSRQRRLLVLLVAIFVVFLSVATSPIVDFCSFVKRPFLWQNKDIRWRVIKYCNTQNTAHILASSIRLSWYSWFRLSWINTKKWGKEKQGAAKIVRVEEISFYRSCLDCWFFFFFVYCAIATFFSFSFFMFIFTVPFWKKRKIEKLILRFVLIRTFFHSLPIWKEVNPIVNEWARTNQFIWLDQQNFSIKRTYSNKRKCLASVLDMVFMLYSVWFHFSIDFFRSFIHFVSTGFCVCSAYIALNTMLVSRMCVSNSDFWIFSHFNVRLVFGQPSIIVGSNWNHWENRLRNSNDCWRHR